MKNLLLLLSFGFTIGVSTLFAQSNDCSTATTITQTANCSSPVAGTTTGATLSIAGCAGTADDDVWYQFIATSTGAQITVTPIAGMDPVVQLFSGTCATLTSLVCKDNGLDGDTETINFTGLTIGQTYRIRVYHYYAGSGTGNFTICVRTPPPAPSNNNCASATSLSVNLACVNTNGTLDGATQSMAGCAGTADDDVWYSFVATNAVQTVTVHPTSDIDPVVQVFSGSCAALSSISCTDNTFMTDDEVVNLVGLTVGQTYFVRVYDWYVDNTGTFQICVTGNPTAAPTNDEACSAIALPEVTSACQYLQFTTTGATASMTAPAPSGCVGGTGGFGASSHDVWFEITVPSTGNIQITPEPNMGAGSITDAAMALYSGTCGALAQVACSDDFNYPGSANDLLPSIYATGLTPGSTVFLRYWGFGATSGNFGLCVTTATNDDCANALYICDINGYSGMTSSNYIADRPGNMFANNETAAGVNLPDGTDSGGIFGQGGPWGSGSPLIDVNINNNSWIKFTASATTAQLTVTVQDCFVGNYPSGGIQMQIFSGTNCASFVPVSNFEESSTQFTITANGLTVGNDYYLMIDGYAGDICGYTISAQSGVQFPDISDVAPICTGQSTTLTAPPGATSYEWAHSGETTQSVNVTPATTQTYYCEVTGLCGFKQLLDVTVTVNPLPIVGAGADFARCAGQTATLSGTGASTYTWDNGVTNGVAFTPASTLTYTVTGTSVAGCTNTDQVQITVNALPTVGAGADFARCAGQTATLSGTGASTYTWNNGVTNGVAFTPASTLNYTVTGTDGNGCTNTDVVQIVVNALPTVGAGTDISRCAGQTATLTGSGASTYSWSNGVTNGVAFTPASTLNYTVTGTDANGCTNTDVVQVIVNTLPTVGAGTDIARCLGQSATLSGTGASTYTWNNGVANGVAFTPVSTQTYTVTGTDGNGCTNTDDVQVTVNSLPTVNAGLDFSRCAGQSATLSGAGASTYTWDNGVTNGVAFTPASTQTYTVTGTDANGCIDTDDVQITVNSNPTPIVQGATEYCTGSSASLSTTISYAGYSWSTGVSTATASATTANNPVTVTVTDANGCQGTSAGFVTTENSTVTSNTSVAICSGQSIVIHGISRNTGGVYSQTFSGGSVTGCDSTSNVTLTVNSLPNVGAGADFARCAGQTATLSGTGASTYTWDNGVTNGVAFTPASTLTYTVTGTDINGCINTDAIQVTVNTLPVVNAGADDDICAGLATTLSGSGASTYTWNNGVTNGVAFTPASTLTYTVTGTDVNGCTDTDDIQIIVNTLPTVNAGLDFAICAGTSTSLSGAGATTYTWNNGVTNGASFTPASTLTYTVTGTDANGCIDTDDIQISVNANPTVGAGSDFAICTGQSTSLSGTGASSYTWNNGVINGNNFTPASTLTYTVTGTDGNGCTDTDDIIVTVNPLPTVNAGLDGAVCAGLSVTLTGSGASTYSWNNGVSNGVAFSPASTLTYTVTGTDANGCIDTDDVQITVNTLPTVGAGVDQAICIGASATLSGSGATSYSWNNGVNNGVSFSPASTLTYTVTGTDGNGCIDTDDVQVTVNALPTVTAGPDFAICAGASTTLNGNGASTFTWNNGVSNGVSFSPISTLTYTVTGTDGNGCINTDQIEVTVNPLPNVMITNGATTAVCAGSSEILVATGATTYSWNEGTINDSLTVSPTIATVFTVTGTTLGCENTANITVNVNALPTLNAAPTATDANCGGSNGALTGVSINGAPTLIYTWTNASSATVGTTQDLTNVPAGSYDLHIEDGNGCENNFGPFTVANPGAPSAPTIVVNDDTPCEGTTITLDASSTNPSATFTWSGPNGFTSNNASISIADLSALETGNYCVYATAAACDGAPTCQTITVQTLPTLSLAVDDADSTICTADDFTLTGTGAVTYNWTGPNGFAQTGNPILISNATSNNDGTYYLNATDVNGCSNFDSIEVAIAPLPTIDANNGAVSSTFCEGSTIDLTASGAQSYAWTGPDNFTSSDQNPTITPALMINAGDYIVVGTDNLGCQASDTVAVVIDAGSFPVAGTPDSIICPGMPIELTATGGQNYTWEGPNNWTGTGTPITIVGTTPAFSGYYVVTSTTTNGCTAQDSVLITVAYNDDCIFIPTLTTPDGNGANDTWDIIGLEAYPDAEVEIYNRWGNLIYYTSPYDVPWDGSVNRGATIDNSGRVPTGTYFYIIRLGDDENTTFKGYVEVQY